MFSLLHFSSVCKSLSVMIEPETDRKCASPMIVTPDKGERMTGARGVRKRIPTGENTVSFKKDTHMILLTYVLKDVG